MKKWLRSLWKGNKRDNRGLTLVELICTVAIFGVVCTAVGSVMVISARTYGRSNDEINLQQEAHLTANQIADLLIDATTEINYDQDTKVMTVKNGDAHYTVALNGDDKTLTYTQVFADGRTNSGVLAENVVDFKMQAEDFTTSGNARVYLKLQVEQKEYDAWYTVTARNGDVTGQAILENTATINTINDITLEPNQVCNLSDYTTVYGTSEDKTLSWSISSANGLSGYTRIMENSGELKIGGDETVDSFIVTVATNARDGYTSIDTKNITVHVRRVKDINVSGVNVSGTDKSAGAEYRVSANAHGSNLARVYGVDYDADYKNPYYVKFDYYMSVDGTNVNVWDYIDLPSLQIKGDVNAPNVSFKLKQSMPVGGKLKVVATAKHPLGTEGSVQTNKTGVAYGNVVGEWVLQGPPAVSNPHTIIGDGILRGSTAFKVGFHCAEGDETYLKTHYPFVDGAGQQYQGTLTTYWRCREVGTTTWSTWQLLCDQGTDYEIHPASNVNGMRPDKDYELELESKIIFNGQVCWPVASTPLEYYHSRFLISHAYCSVTASAPISFEDKLGVGSYSNPIVVSKSANTAEFLCGYSNMYGTDSDYLQKTLVMDVKNLSISGRDNNESRVRMDGFYFNFRNADTGLYRITFHWNWQWNGHTETLPYSEVVPDGEAGAGIFYIRVDP